MDERPAKRAKTSMPPPVNYSPIEQYLFLEVGALHARMSVMEQERSELLERLDTMDRILWRLLRDPTAYLSEAVQQVIAEESERVEDTHLDDLLTEFEDFEALQQEEWEETLEQFLRDN